MMEELLKVKDLCVYYPVRSGMFKHVNDYVYAVDGVSFDIKPGESYGVIGESGSGKSTIGQTLVGLLEATSGTITYAGKDVTDKHVRKKMQYNKEVQMIFQDSLSSLNPKKKIIDIIGEPLKNFENLKGVALKKRVVELLKTVGLDEEALYKYPYQFSGGQRQRIGVARAVAPRPKLIIADEPVSALDLSVQAQVLNYMKDIQEKYGVAYLFISHDLGVVHHMCDRLAIMHKGRFVEVGTRDDIYEDPLHIYTKRLLAAIPQTNVLLRKKHRDERQRLECEYDSLKEDYYDKNGHVYPLEQITKTHAVALKKE
ncbi:ABC-type oligopeptide transport system, ATPase component [Ligilactobacillus apodemi DSM 16634 = JCM 16172]|uniref:ABC-type oligopeptide transport system, ATPase component n=2 Tax=Ligilactobacillus TaxID=2767887 RepID=A0A0R1U2X3_9LACO|nr:ABC-type oligopeptide transport system, ATPase component [Ligilactobacillus apodemi DSM 16634 = JCM 16172]